MSFALVRLFLGGALKKLAGLNVWQIALIVALLFGAVQTIRLKAEQRHAHKVGAQLSKATGELKRLREESKAQQQQVGKVVDHYVTVTKPEVIRQREKIENAPLPGNCKTPSEVTGADL